MKFLVGDILTWLLIIIGHLGVWCSLYSRIHATAWPRAHRKISEKTTFLIILAPMAWVLTILITQRTTSLNEIYWISPVAFWYGVGCLLISPVFIFRWAHRKLTYRLPAMVTAETSEMVDVGSRVQQPLLSGFGTRLWGSLSINQIQSLAIERKTFSLPRCPQALNGLRICHLSDLHFTGQLAREFFEEVVREANAFEPDLILITGDIVDKIQCLEWIEAILGKLSASLGVYYVLGNHDLRIRNESLLRSKLADAGIIAASGSWHAIRTKNVVIALSGNELPWYKGAEKLPLEPPTGEGHGSEILKILLSHSPDQVKWAQRYDFDLMLAGHTHGGQIRFPIVGPIVAPSKYGVKHCSGTFDINGMLLHVSRGISGDDPIRINCPPELGLFTLQA